MITKPVIFGNKSSYFGKKRESDGHTHSWTCYFKSFNNEVKLVICNCYQKVGLVYILVYMSLQDVSSYIKKVQFKLHESYANPTRGNMINNPESPPQKKIAPPPRNVNVY